MRFRTRIFLSILLPATILVAVAVIAALKRINRTAEVAANDGFQRLSGALEGVLGDLGRELDTVEKTWSGPRYRAIVLAGVRPGGAGTLADALDEQHAIQRYRPDFYAVRNADGGIVVRRSTVHDCGSNCDHPLEEWAIEHSRALVSLDGEPFLVVRVAYDDEAWYLFGSHVRADLDRLRRDFGLDLVLRFRDETVYTSLPAWTPILEAQGSILIGEDRYLARRFEQGDLAIEILMFRSMEGVLLERRRVMTDGAIGLAAAVIVATLIAFLVSRGISRPVETLVGATQRVGKGDFSASVDIAGRDEMGRLGDAFNAMTRGLRQRQEIMEKTLSRDVADEAMKGMELGGKRCDVTILFMDVRGFTHATEGVDPAEVVTTLNDMMKALADAVDRHGGNVNKYLGDGMMAMFGAPRPLEDHAKCAVRAALEMKVEMEKWNAARAGKRLELGQLQIGIGINTGTVVGGYVGSERRLEYTLIGEEVNLAARVCGKAAPGQVLVTWMTHERLGDGFSARQLEPIQVKGLSYPIKVFEVIPG